MSGVRILHDAIVHTFYTRHNLQVIEDREGIEVYAVSSFAQLNIYNILRGLQIC